MTIVVKDFLKLLLDGQRSIAFEKITKDRRKG